MTVNIFLCILSGLFGVFSFPRFDIFPLAFFSLLPLFFALYRANYLPKRSFFLGWLCGITFFVGHLWWIPYTQRIDVMGYPALLLLSLYQGLYFAVFSLFCAFFLKQKNYFLKIFAVPSVWVLLEYVRGYGVVGFPWGSLCYSQYKNLPLIQISEITGMLGVSFIIVAVNLTFFEIAREKQCGKLKYKKYLIFFILLFSIYTWGYFEVTKERCPCGLKKVALVQGNVEKNVVWNYEYTQYMTEKYVSLSKKAISKYPDVEIVVWPETVIPYGTLNDDFLKNIFESAAKKLNKYLIVGCFDKEENKLYNAGVIFSPQGEIIGKYYKMQLVLFGETVPSFIRKMLKRINYDPWQDGGVNLTRGKNFNVIKTYFGNIGFNICFETVFPYISRITTKNGAQLLVALVADSWFEKDTTYQHTSMAVFRCVENRRYLVRCADTGITCIISPKGKIVKKTEPFVEDVLVGDVEFLSYKTFYTRFGDVFVIFCLIAFGTCSILAIKYGKSS